MNAKDNPSRFSVSSEIEIAKNFSEVNKAEEFSEGK
jgi:hypothetical protein